MNTWLKNDMRELIVFVKVHDADTEKKVAGLVLFMKQLFPRIEAERVQINLTEILDKQKHKLLIHNIKPISEFSDEFRYVLFNLN